MRRKWKYAWRVHKKRRRGRAFALTAALLLLVSALGAGILLLSPQYALLRTAAVARQQGMEAVLARMTDDCREKPGTCSACTAIP